MHRKTPKTALVIGLSTLFLGACMYTMPEFANYLDPKGKFTVSDLPFPDPAFREAVLAQGRANGSMAISGITYLSAGNLGITSLEGIQYLQSLTGVWLDGNRISDITPLGKLPKLEQVSIGNNPIADLSPLANLGSLIGLSLWSISLRDSTALEAMLPGWSGLENFSVDGNLLTSGNSLLRLLAAKPSMRSIHLNNCGVSDLSPLAGASLDKLEDLSLGWEADQSTGASGISDITPLVTLLSRPGSLPLLSNLCLEGNAITNGDALLAALAGRTSLTSLQVGSCGVSDLGFSHVASLTNLTNISAGGNTISDLAPLRNLTRLTDIWMSGNKITSFTPIVSLITALSQSLTGLGVGDNPVTSGGDALVSALAGNTRITNVNLNNCHISDITGLGSMSALTDISLGGNDIVEVGALANLSGGIRSLNLSGNRITSVAPLVSLVGNSPDLNYLDLSNNRDTNNATTIGDASVLVAAFQGRTFASLNNLNLSDCALSDISPLGGLTALVYVSLGGNQITDASALSNLSNVRSLGLNGNRIRSVAPLVPLVANSPSLSYLDLNSNQDLNGDATIGDGQVLVAAFRGKAFASLNNLQLGNSGISDISDLSGLTALTDLGIWGNRIVDISALSGMTRLRSLWISGNQIVDLSPLARCTAIDRMDASGNQVASGLTSLYSMTRATWIGIGNNPPITEADLAALRAALPGCSIP